MKSVFKSNNYNEKSITRIFPKNFKTEKIKEHIIERKDGSFNAKIIEILLDGIKITIRNEEIKTPFIVEVEHDFPFLKIHFEVNGSSIYTPKNKESIAINIPNGHYNFFYLPKVKGVLQYDNPSRKTLEIIFTKDYLKRVFGKSLKESCSDFGDAIEKDISYKMWEQSKPITPQLQLLIEDIINCKYQDGLKKAYLESKITEITTIFLANIKAKKNSENKININVNDYKKVVEAEKILCENLKNPPTISELSLKTGLNEFKLKQYFKVVFQKPIFSYLTEVRMETSKKLISKNNFTISEAAYKVGYKNPQHFTVAFKKKYNYLPSSLKQH